MAEINLCSIDSCNKPKHRTSKLYCSMHSERKRKGLDMLSPPRLSAPGVPQEFFNLLDRGVQDCIIWPFGMTSSGYAQFSPPAPYTSRIVSRCVCIKFNGYPVNKTDEAAHSCGKGHLGCVNPDHLDWKSHKGNHQDRIRHGTNLSGVKNPMAKLTENDVLSMRKLRKNQATYQSIADLFGVDYRTAYNACTRKTWPNI